MFKKGDSSAKAIAHALMMRTKKVVKRRKPRPLSLLEMLFGRRR